MLNFYLKFSSYILYFLNYSLGENDANLIKFDNTEKRSVITKEGTGKPIIEGTENIPEEWLEIQMTEGDIIDPLTPIDPAKINPAMAAATLKHLKGGSKINTPITITIPSITTSDSGKKNISEKKIIYLTDENIAAQKTTKKKKPMTLKLDVNNKKK